MWTRRPACIVVAFVLAIGAVAKAGDANRPRLVVQSGHALPLVAVAYSPHGDRILTGSFDQAARLWDIETGLEIRRFEGHEGPVMTVVFSPDGPRILTGSQDRTARLWDIETGKELHRFPGHTARVYAAAFRPGYGQVVTGSFHQSARLWDVETGREVRRFDGHAGIVVAVAFSSDGRQLLTGSTDRTARLWDPDTGREIKQLAAQGDLVTAVAFSPDGKRLLTGARDGKIRLWDAETGREIRRFTGHEDSVRTLLFSPGGRLVLSCNRRGTKDPTARVWDVETGALLWSDAAKGHFEHPAAFSPDGRLVLLGSADAEHATPVLRDTDSGELKRVFPPHAAVALSLALSPDGNRVLTGCCGWSARMWDLCRGEQTLVFTRGRERGAPWVCFSADGPRALVDLEDGTLELWDAPTGRSLGRFEGHRQLVWGAAFSTDGRSLLTGSHDKTARVWSIDTPREIMKLVGDTGPVLCVAFAPDGRHVVTGNSDKTIRVWDVATGREIRRFEGHEMGVTAVVVSSDGRFILSGSGDRTARLWEFDSGREVRSFEGHAGNVCSLAISSDGRRLLTGGGIRDQTARLWDVDTGRELQMYGGAGPINCVVFSPDEERVFTASQDGTTRIWDAESGTEVCRLVSFLDGTWAVTDPTGRYDASNGGEVQGLHWVIGNEPISLDQLKERYYDPGLLSKHLGFNPEPLREVAAFDSPKLYPQVEVDPPVGEAAMLSIHLKNKGGGLGRVVVLVNGKELTADARGPGLDPEAEEANLVVDLAEDSRLIPGEPNTIEVMAYNVEGYLRSRGVRVKYTPPGKASEDPPELWAVVVGVSDYAGGKSLDLNYAAKDAEDFAYALELAAKRFFGEERVHLTTLTESEGEGRPTRKALLASLEAVRASKPRDLLVVYLAGHGVNHGGQDGDFHYLTADARSTELTDPEVRRTVALSSRELTEIIKELPPLKQVLVLDTCAAGRLVEKLSERGDVPSSQVRALERLKDRTGFFVLAGCAADAFSYEATPYAQGLLTYSLLFGMKGAALGEEELVDVSRLFEFAADRVPELAKGLGRIQRPIIAAPKGTSFYIGRLTEPDREKVPLNAVRPLFIRSAFNDEDAIEDVLGLGKAVNRLLSDLSARGRDSKLAFVGGIGFPEAYRLVGRYRINGDEVAVDVRLRRGKEQQAQFSARGRKSDLAALAERIVEEARKRLE